MEKVKVVKAIPGMLNIGDILVSPAAGEDFCLSETKVTKNGSSDRFVSLDYVTVSENIPQFFNFVNDSCACTDCICIDKNEIAENMLIRDSEIIRSEEEIQNRYNFFERQFQLSPINSEAQIVYKNLMWFIEWLQGKTQLI